MEEIFTNIYENCVWGNNNNGNYTGSSGGGSDVSFNKDSYIPFLKQFILRNNVKSVVDLGCGDFKCGPHIYDNLNITYTGYDVYNKVIIHNKANHSPDKYNFIHLDFWKKKEDIISGDLCILKDVLQHWSLSYIYTFLDYLVDNKKFKYIVLCNCCNQTRDNTSINNGEGMPLSCAYLPLRKYGPIKQFNYKTKEVSVITLF